MLITRIKQKVFHYYRQIRLKHRDFTIISNNCWGGFIYQYANIRYRTPFIGLFILGPDYIKLLEDFDKILNCKLTFISPTKSKYYKYLIDQKITIGYPIGLLRDVEIHFQHYKTQEEAREKWERRAARINHQRLIFKISERDLVSRDIIKRFHELPYHNKISITATNFRHRNNLKLSNENGSFVKDEWDSFLAINDPIKIINNLL